MVSWARRASASGNRWSMAILTTPDLADPGLQAQLVRQMDEATAGAPLATLAQAQDRALLALLQSLDPPQAGAGKAPSAL